MIESLTQDGAPGIVTVYTRSGCATCQAVKAFLAEKGVTFEEKDITQDSIAADELATLTQGAATAPVVVIGQKVVVGFDRPELSKELGLN
ncbi:MAG TPA: glutaredoxin family protein [Planctomycetota bacterium]|nr:glutaredoxin family protein [Planctomycetota bacterium]